MSEDMKIFLGGVTVCALGAGCMLLMLLVL